ncbi:MAG: 50S ribosomal protein L11 methyltransferase [Bradyrhizobiaceae bacterium]|nr:50S ribosomal protein L11 methyltransferase [Bradyrhizobiaceae bacterium]
MVGGSSTETTVRAHLKIGEKEAGPLSDALAAHFNDGDAVVASCEDAAGDWIVEIHFAHPPDEGALRDFVFVVAGESAARALTFSTVSERDWTAASLAGLHPVSAGRFIVYGAHDRARVGQSRIGIEIEAALAFGTGHHGTTRGCLLALDQIVRTCRPRRVLDVGTGTGVLAIAAAKALHRPVVASDSDREAVIIARANAQTNRVASLINVVHAVGLTGRQSQSSVFDLVLANILLGPLKSMAPQMRRILAPNARVVLSGLLVSQANAALSVYRAHGLTLERRIALDGWMTLVLRRGGRHGRR